MGGCCFCFVLFCLFNEKVRKRLLFFFVSLFFFFLVSKRRGELLTHLFIVHGVLSAFAPCNELSVAFYAVLRWGLYLNRGSL